MTPPEVFGDDVNRYRQARYEPEPERDVAARQQQSGQQIPSALDEVEKRIAGAEAVLNTLVDRLQPVLSPQGPDLAATADRPPAETSQIAERLHGVTYGIRRFSGRLDDLIRRLDL